MKLSLALLISSFFITLTTCEATEDGRKFFNQWARHFNKRYKSQTDEDKAMATVLANKREIDEHNQLHDEGKVSFRRGIWEHSDMSSEEKQKFLYGFKSPYQSSRPTRELPPYPEYPQYPTGPSSVDWTERGLVGPVRNQGRFRTLKKRIKKLKFDFPGRCASCWAFAVAEVVQSILRRSNITDMVSTQQLVDCNKDNKACAGGLTEYGLDYVKVRGIERESSYPYEQKEGTCGYNAKKSYVVIKEVMNIPTRGNETWLR